MWKHSVGRTSTEVTDGVRIIYFRMVRIIYSRLPLHMICFVFRRNMWLIKPLDLEVFASQISPSLNIFKACLVCEHQEKVKTVKIVYYSSQCIFFSFTLCIWRTPSVYCTPGTSVRNCKSTRKLFHKVKSKGSPLGFCTDVFSVIKTGLYSWVDAGKSALETIIGGEVLLFLYYYIL